MCQNTSQLKRSKLLTKPHFLKISQNQNHLANKAIPYSNLQTRFDEQSEVKRAHSLPNTSRGNFNR